MLFRLSLIMLFLIVSFNTKAQTKWSLKQCIDYALINAITIKEADLQKKLSALTASQTKSSVWPSANFSGSSGYRFGLSENPTTGTLQANNFFSSGLSFSTNVTLFNWFSKRYSLQATQLQVKGDEAGIEKEKNNVVLNVNAAYLQALLSKELVTTTTLQLQQTNALLIATRKKISVGLLSELDAFQVQLQLLKDSLALASAEEAKDKSILQLKAVLNYDTNAPLDIEDADLLSQSLAAYNPETLYSIASVSLPQIKQIDYGIEAARFRTKAAKAERYPAFSLYGSAGTNYVNIPSAKTFTYIPSQSTGATVLVNGVSYEVVSPSYQVSTYGVTPFLDQFTKNFGQNIGVSVTIPVFNGRSQTTAWKREGINFSQLKLQKERLLHDLKTAIYISYEEAVSALEKVRIQEKISTEAMAVFDASQKRYNLNLLSTQDLLISRNSFEQARVDLFLARYNLVFKIKELEFYKLLD